MRELIKIISYIKLKITTSNKETFDGYFPVKVPKNNSIDITEVIKSFMECDENGLVYVLNDANSITYIKMSEIISINIDVSVNNSNLFANNN